MLSSKPPSKKKRSLRLIVGVGRFEVCGGVQDFQSLLAFECFGSQCFRAAAV